MPNKKDKLKVFIIAGEVSGDVLGARIIAELKDSATFVGIGGEHMQKEGLHSLFPMSDLAVMGIIEVLANAKTLTRRIKDTVQAILEEKPDLILTIDSPGFAKAVVKKVRSLPAGKSLIEQGLRFHHVVAPQVWAWRPGRARKYAKIFDKLYAFFEFEKPYFTKYGLDTVAIGHPLASRLLNDNSANTLKEKVIALMPGSRLSEVKKLLPLLKDVAERLNGGGFLDYKFVIPTVETTREFIENSVKTWKVHPTLISSSDRYELYKSTYIAIAASGTVSVELAMLHIPAIIVYKMNALTSLVARVLVKVKWVSLVNILENKEIYPELLGADATTENILEAFQQLTIPSVREKMVKKLKDADKKWLYKNQDASKLIAREVKKLK